MGDGLPGQAPGDQAPGLYQVLDHEEGPAPAPQGGLSTFYTTGYSQTSCKFIRLVKQLFYY